jgi:hypothetical protein
MKAMECNLSRTRKLDKLQELVLQIMEVEKGMKVIGLDYNSWGLAYHISKVFS